MTLLDIISTEPFANSDTATCWW